MCFFVYTEQSFLKVWLFHPSSCERSTHTLRLLAHLGKDITSVSLLWFLPRSQPHDSVQDCMIWVFGRCALKGSGRNVAERTAAKAPRSCNNRLRRSLTERRAGDWERRLQVTAHLDFHLSKPCLLWLTRASHRGIDFPGKRWMWHAPQLWENPGSCGQRRFLEIWKGIGVTLRWQCDVVRSLEKTNQTIVDFF